MFTTEFSVLDRNGNPLCHTDGQVRSNLNNARRARLLAPVWDMWEAAGLYLPHDGSVRCVFSGAWLNRGTPHTEPMAVHMCHDIPDEWGGPLCGCNLLPGMAAINLSTGARGRQTLVTPVMTGLDPRAAWRSTWLATLATGTKAARAA